MSTTATAPAAAGAAPEAEAKSGKKKLIIIVVLVLLLGGGGGYWFFLKPAGASHLMVRAPSNSCLVVARQGQYPSRVLSSLTCCTDTPVVM